MARTLSNFLVGIGWDKDDFDKGTRDIERSFDGIKSVGTKLGVALAGVMGAAALSVINTAHAMDQLNIGMHNADASTQYIYNMGNALERFGGNAQDAVSEYNRLQTAVDQYQKLGKADLFTALAGAGIDVSWASQVKNAEDLQKRLADIISTSTPQQRRMIQEVTGFSNATMLLYERGSKGLDDQLDKSESLTGSIDDLTQKSREFNEQWAEAGQNIDHFQNLLAEKLLPRMTDAVKKANQWAEANQRIQGKVIDKAIDTVINLPGTTTGAVASGGTSLTGSVLSKLGLNGLGKAIKLPFFEVGMAYDKISGSIDDWHRLDERLKTGKPISWSEVVNPNDMGKPYESALFSSAADDKYRIALGGTKKTNESVLFPDSLNDKYRIALKGEGESWQATSYAPPTANANSKTPDSHYGLPQPTTNYAPSSLDYSPKSPMQNTTDIKQQAAITGDAMAESLRRNPIKVDVNVNSQLMLDGRVLNEQIDNRVFEHNQNTADALQSTTAR